MNYSGKRTGRVPKEKRTVLDKHTKDKVWWGDVNIPFEPVKFDLLFEKMLSYLKNKELFAHLN